jgi:hypothetical protein
VHYVAHTISIYRHVQEHGMVWSGN